MNETISKGNGFIKRNFVILIILFAVGMANLLIQLCKVDVGKFNECFYISFNSFIQELENINNDISKVLISEEQLEKYIEKNKKEDKIIWNFYVLIGRLDSFNRKYDRTYLERLWSARENLYDYVSDNKLDVQEI